MALDVHVTIAVSKPMGSYGFGIPLLFECGVTSNPVGYTVCQSLDDITKAGIKTTDAMYKAANMVFSQENRPAKIAVYQSSEDDIVSALPAIVDRDWRQLVIVNGDSSQYVEAADYIEATGSKMMFISMSATAFSTFKTSIASKTYDRTVIFVNSTENAAAGLVGATAGKPAGSFSYKFKTIKGVAAETFTDSEIEALHTAGAFGYVTKAGDDITTEGITQSGEYIDIIDSKDYVIQAISYNNQKVFNNTDKVTFDNRGISLLESATVSALQDAFNNGIIAVQDDGSTPDYEVYFAPRSATTESDRASRTYKYGTFKFALAGAIHKVYIDGSVVY